MSQVEMDAHNGQEPYEVTREYRFFEGEEKPNPDSDVVADVSFYPPATRQFAIRESRGAGRGQHIIKKVLEHESEIASQWRQSAILDDNYRFSLLGEETLNGRRCFVLGLEPRRQARELLKGKAWVDAEDYRIRQIQGEPAKNPSFWIKRLELTLYFSEVQGMWMQTAIHAAADVRLFGRNTLSEHDLNYRVGNAMAARRGTLH